MLEDRIVMSKFCLRIKSKLSWLARLLRLLNQFVKVGIHHERPRMANAELKFTFVLQWNQVHFLKLIN